MPLEWTCEALRLSLFSPEAVRLSAEQWNRLTGQVEPEQEQKGGGRHLFASQLLGGQLSLGAIANRCDCVLNAVITADSDDDNIPSVGPWPAALERFQQPAEALIQHLPFPVNRMAFAPVLLNRCANRLEAYRRLASIVKSLKQPPENLRDVLFRINWPQRSTTDNGLLLNRLTTFSVLQIQLQVVVSDGGARPVVTDPTYVLRLELDLNTDPQHVAPFDVSDLVPIYRELSNLALQNAEEGEVM
ncbi:hypothetical protein [Bradyrhizobium pachyrhizi]|uniref:hypothetical protein n=1 Tax=Bradyrhizobium pachyrhizi TaxID=280333 RepID=UPI003D36F27E